MQIAFRPISLLHIPSNFLRLSASLLLHTGYCFSIARCIDDCRPACFTSRCVDSSYLCIVIVGICFIYKNFVPKGYWWRSRFSSLQGNEFKSTMSVVFAFATSILKDGEPRWLTIVFCQLHTRALW